jgi:hypothetical protein
VIGVECTFCANNSKSSRRTGLQRVFVRPKRLYTRPPLSLPRPEPTLHVGSGHVSRIVGTFGAEVATLDQGRRASSDASSAPPLAPDATSRASALRPWPPWALVTGAPPLAPSAPKVGAATKGHPYTTKLIRHKRHQCFVSAHAAKGLLARPKPYACRRFPAWAGKGDASEDQLPQQRAPHTMLAELGHTMRAPWATSPAPPWGAPVPEPRGDIPASQGSD